MPWSGENRQLASTLCVNLLAFSIGISMAWPSYAMSFLESPSTDLHSGPFTHAESALVNSLFSIGGLVGSLTFGYFCDVIGRVWALRAIAGLHLISYLILAFSHSIVWISISRFVIGIAGGAIYIAIPLYVSEIAEDIIRGSLGSILMLSQAIGIFISYVCGAFLNIDYLSWIYIWFPAFFILFSLSLYETPFHLLRSGKITDAQESLMFYRGVNSLQDKKVMNEFDGLITFVNFYNARKITKAARKSLVIGIALVVLEEFSGCYLLLYRVGSIFDNFEGISPDIASIIIGFIQVAGAYCSTLLIERLGRKILTIASSVGILLGMLLTGFTIPLNDNANSFFFFKLLPVFGLSFALFSANIGAFVLTYVVLAEITPSKVRSQIFTICIGLSWIFSFAIFNIEVPITESFGVSGLMFYFAINTVLGAIFIIIFMPETRGRSFEEIAEIMQN